MALDADIFDALIAQLRRFVAERLRPLEAQVEADDAVPAHIIAEMKAMGLFGLSIAPEHGGLGLTMAEEARVAIEMGRTTPAFRSAFGTNVGIGSQGLVIAGSPEQQETWLPRIASGEIITSFALTEPDIGSDSGAVKARAVRDGDVYRLSGTKRYITNADRADLFTVMARTGDDPGARGVSAFLVPRDLPGITIGTPEKKMGQRGAKVADVTFDDVPVPVANRLGAEGEGFRIAMRVLDRGRLHIAAVCVGVAERLIADGRPRRGPRGADLRRRRLYRGLRHRAAVPRCSPVPHLRGHQPDPAAHHRPRDAQARRLIPGGHPSWTPPPCSASTVASLLSPAARAASAG